MNPITFQSHTRSTIQWAFLFLFLFSGVTAGQLSAQRTFGVSAGALYNLVGVDGFDVFSDYQKYGGATGYQVNGFVYQPIRPKWGVQAELGFRNLPYTAIFPFESDIRQNNFSIDLQAIPMFRSASRHFNIGAGAGLDYMIQPGFGVRQLATVGLFRFEKRYGRFGVGVTLGHSLEPFKTIINPGKSEYFYHRFGGLHLSYQIK